MPTKRSVSGSQVRTASSVSGGSGPPTLPGISAVSASRSSTVTAF